MPSDEEAAPSATIIAAIAEREGVDPVDLDVSLHEVVDPDALDVLFVRGRPDAEVYVEFTFAGYRVAVEHEPDGSVRVRVTDQDDASP